VSTHPGTVLFVDERGESVARSIDEVPEALRFARDASGALIAVTRVEATAAGDTRTIREYSADGQLLRSTLQRRTGGADRAR
jgi:hypothetical protein